MITRRKLTVALLLALAASLAWLAIFPVGQQPDRSYRPHVERPANVTRHPRLLVDEGHFNSHTSGGGYAPFARLMRADGFEVERHRGRFTHESIASADVLVVVNADGGSNPKLCGINLVFLREGERGSPAFTPEEIELVEAWVRNGGSLLLVADHVPFGSAAAPMAAAFGVRMHGGFAGVPAAYASPNDSGEVVFTRANGLIGEHPITRGRDERESVRDLRSFTGQSLDPGPGTIVLRLPAGSTDSMPNDPKEYAAGSAQCVAIEHGKGRVVILGEAAMLTAQVEGRSRWGMNMRDLDNEQFALNLVRWLSRAL